MEVRLNDLTKNGSVTIIVPDGEYKIEQNGSSIQISKSGKTVFSSAEDKATPKQKIYEEVFIKSEFADG